ncbi:MAG TPA: hypothetical protein VF395_21845 [Polyangiaceae bacterium]
MTSPRRKRAFLVLAYGTLAVLAALYFFQSSTLAPNQTDDGLLLQYIDAMAHGERPFFDFVDAYGLVNWILPVTFYKAFGNRVWGVRMWMILLKVITVAAAYLLTHALAREPLVTELPGTGGAADEESRGKTGPLGRGHFYAGFSALFTTILLGAQWQSLQTAYAFITVMPIVLFGWYFLLCAPLRDPKKNVAVAALLTAMAIWTKLNTGMYLFAGGLFSYFFWVPRTLDGEASSGEGRKTERRIFVQLRVVGAMAYAVLFSLSIRRYFNVWFFLFLTLPLVIGLGWSMIATTRSEASKVDPRAHLEPFFRYLLTTLALSLLVLFGYYGKHAGEYARELSGILSHIKYTAPFPALGKPGLYVGLNEYYWLELPWLLTALFVVWIFAGSGRGAPTFGEEWPRRRAQVSSLFVLITLHTFVMYARSDETHIFQALVLVMPVLFVVLAQLDAFLCARRPSIRFPLRFGLVSFGLLYAGTLAVMPTMDAFAIGQSDWTSPKFEHLRYRRLNSPYVREFATQLYDRDWDIADDQAAAYVKSISLHDEEMLLLTANRLVYLNSDTRPIGGRYHFFFYLASVGLLDREGFDALVPKSVVDDILERPPRVIVAGIGWVPLAVVFPEFAWIRDNYYEQTRHYRHIIVYELRIDGEPVQSPLR